MRSFSENSNRHRERVNEDAFIYSKVRIPHDLYPLQAGMTFHSKQRRIVIGNQ